MKLISGLNGLGNKKRREERHREIVERKRIIELSDVAASGPNRVIEIELRFGTEYWALFAQQIELESPRRIIRDAKLIVKGGNPRLSSAAIRELGEHPERIIIRH